MSLTTGDHKLLKKEQNKHLVHTVGK